MDETLKKRAIEGVDERVNDWLSRGISKYLSERQAAVLDIDSPSVITEEHEAHTDDIIGAPRIVRGFGTIGLMAFLNRGLYCDPNELSDLTGKATLSLHDIADSIMTDIQLTAGVDPGNIRATETARLLQCLTDTERRW
jgi:hypothetical protein